MDDKIFDQVHDVDLKKTMETSYIDYAMSVIASRALPDVRDGLKPVQRRVLYSMIELNNGPDKPHRKCARIVGDTMGKYHPHGDSSIYGALVNMAQEWSTRYPLVDGHGNFGSVDGDGAAAMRYTEARLSKISMEMLADIGKNTVDFMPNFDETEKEPVVLPSRYPNLLVNGTSGIAVGMATNIPPHNLGELCDALLLLINDPDTGVDELMQFVKGPDFPTGGQVYAGQGLVDAYRTGRGIVKMRGRMEVKERGKNTQSIVITEIPYAVNKSGLVEKIAALVNDRRIEGVSDLKDLSDRNGIRIEVELKRGTIPDLVINALYKYTPMESSFGINMLAVLNNRPVLFNLKSALTCFLDHRREVIIRRSRFDLNKAEARAHIVEGLLKALDIIDEIVALIKASETPQIAKQGLADTFGFTEIQAQSILDMRLQRLTGLEHDKLQEEFDELMKLIAYLKSVLEDSEVLRGVMRDEMVMVKENYATERKTEVVGEALSGIDIEDLIPDEEVVITLSRRGYIKRTTLGNYQQQKRGGKGIAGLNTGDDDFVQDFITTTNHQYLCLFTNKGRMYQLKVYQVPEGSRTAKGMHIANLLPLEKEEFVANVLTVREFAENQHFFFATRSGMVKKSSAALYEKCRKSGLIALSIKDDDELIAVHQVEESDTIVLATKMGMAIRFSCQDVRSMGRGASGVKGISLRKNDEVVSCLPIKDDDNTTEIMSISELGYGKRTCVELYRRQNRGGIGIINFKVSPKTGNVIGSIPVTDEDSLILLTSTNKIIRLGVKEISSYGRATMGIRLVSLDDNATVVGYDTVPTGKGDEDGADTE